FGTNSLTISKRIFDLNNFVYDADSKSLVKPKEKDEKRPKLFQKEYLEQSNESAVYNKALTDWISFCKNFLALYESTSVYNFNFDKHTSFDSLDSFYTYINTVTYKISFRNISEIYINKLVDEGKLYLFQIYNKDFSTFSKGKPNLHTLYWKMLFDEKNLQNVVYKLNGQAEVFYRKKSLNYDEKTLREGHHIEKLKNKFNYPIISNKRFAFDKFQLHVPITMNFKATGGDNINADVLAFLKNNPDINIIGIDRGERHLLYLSLINQQGEIIRQMTLNEIINSYSKDGKTFDIRTNYHEKLDQKEAEREKARKDWGVIENIKELKEGYLSHVVHVIATMMVEQNAIVVMEDLNFGFKRGRQKVEKQVYQKFEKMLIDKLNYLVFKSRAVNEVGGALKALQLANKFESFQKLGKQSGFIFYVPASLTSKIDPATGFVDFLKPKYESIEKAKSFIEKFKSIHYNTEKQWFEFSFDYKDFLQNFENGKSTWTVCSTHVPRYRWNAKLNQGKGAQEEVNVTQALEALFGNANIMYGGGKNVKDQISAQTSADFFKELLRVLATLLSLRHNNGKKGEEEQDYILSPVAPFFDSRNADATQPQNADANGAYNIAKKGLLVLKRLRGEEGYKKLDKRGKPDLFITNKEWLEFTQNKVHTLTS
ncbi:MAG: type V CRISPR-associated protein Cas12a/Cpf1, partial [Bacteroidota bacterium]